MCQVKCSSLFICIQRNYSHAQYNNTATVNNYWTKLSKISWFVRSEEINYSASANNWSARHWQITIFCDHRVCSLFNIFGKVAICHFHERCDQKKENSVFHLRMSRILFAAKHSWTTLRMSRQFFRQFFAGHVVVSRPMEREKILHRMIIIFIFP